jgi:hypothetical protein
MLVNYLGFLGFRRNDSAYVTKSNASLLALSNRLSHWNIERISRKKTNAQPLDLTVEDVNLLKEIIQTAINKATVKYPEVMSDQLLFLAIGAIQVQTQTSSDKAWQLVSQSIQTFLNTQQKTQSFLVGLSTITLLLSLSVMSMLNTQINHVSHRPPDSPLSITEGTTDPVTISTLLLAYNKMKSGTCQLPQAAMLPPEQRQAFLMFVNNGTVEVQHVENLRLALGYVNCLYPQELMHPTGSTGNRL